jgi:uncharacterized damage-inducible protein DinB
MPVPTSIAHAAEDFRFNNGFLLNMVKDLPPAEWLRRPADGTNHITWIMGHIIWTRRAILARLGTEWSAPWLGLFARGVKLDESTAYPSSATLIDAWKEVSGMLDGALENASEDALAKPITPPAPPSADGKISGVIRFLAWHETYHVGQISLVSCTLGHKGSMG